MTTSSTFFEWLVFILRNFGPSLLYGAGNTLAIAFTGTAAGCVIGLAVGIVNTIPIDKNNSRVERIFL